MYSVDLAPSAERDIERIYRSLEERVEAGILHPGYPDRWYFDVEFAIERLSEFPHRHPFAPERYRLRRDVRNVLLGSGYRILFEVHGEVVWVLRVRHQRQNQLRTLGPVRGYRV